jgi:predicted metal-dependent hydrolase
MESIFYDNIEIKYIITKRGTKNLYARLDEFDVVKISVPLFITKKSIEKFVIESYFKLIKRKYKKKKSIINDDKINILGTKYDISGIDDLNYLITLKLKEYIRENYLNICQKLNIVKPPVIKLKKVKGYLGQYNKKNDQITLNVLIAHMDKECVEYVLIHELVHIKYMNHQSAFWMEVEKYLPNYRKVRSRCKKEFVYYENY